MRRSYSFFRPLYKDHDNRIDAPALARARVFDLLEATASLPPEIQSLSGQEINHKLKARLRELPAAVDRYYALLARRVDVVGSNKAEVFRIGRRAGGRVRVREFDRQGDSPEPHGPALFDRTFEPSETAEICVYGLDGQDIFRVTGQGGPHSIVVRVIGGAGKDTITDDSRARPAPPHQSV